MLENPRDRGAWWATVHGVAKSRTQLSDFSSTVHGVAKSRTQLSDFSSLHFSRQRRIWNKLPSISLIPCLCFQVTSFFLFQRLWTSPILLVFPTLSSQEMTSPPPSQMKQKPSGENSFRILPLIPNLSVPTLWSSCHNSIEV